MHKRMHLGGCLPVAFRRRFCSYTCTPDGLAQMVTDTGVYDRWAEAVAEASYGALSLAPDPQITVGSSWGGTASSEQERVDRP